MNDEMQALPSSDVSFALALIPDEPMYSAIANVSTAISKLTENRNLIDNIEFPAHLSLLLAGLTQSGLEYLEELVEGERITRPRAKAVRLYSGGRGFIGVDLEGSGVDQIQDQLLGCLVKAHQRSPSIRPHLGARWSRLSVEEKQSLYELGTYKVGDKFDKHLSVAQVDREDADDMMSFARTQLRFPQSVEFGLLQLVDIGHDNSKWRVIRSWKLPHPS